VDAKDKYSQTPLVWAASRGHEAVVKMLLDTGKVDMAAEHILCLAGHPYGWLPKRGTKQWSTYCSRDL
jgi:hypothetical protein